MKNRMNTYISVRATNYSTVPSINSGSVYTSVENCKLEVYTPVSYTAAKKQMVKLAVKYNMKIERKLNPLDPTIITYEIGGFLD